MSQREAHLIKEQAKKDRKKARRLKNEPK